MVSLAVLFLMLFSLFPFPLISSFFFFFSVCYYFHPVSRLLLPPLRLLYHGCITSCVTAEPEPGKGSQFEVAVATTGFINPHWMSCLWMHHYQMASCLHSNCLLSEWAKAMPGKYNLQTKIQTQTNKHIHKCTITCLNDLKVQLQHFHSAISRVKQSNGEAPLHTVQQVDCNKYSPIHNVYDCCNCRTPNWTINHSSPYPLITVQRFVF